jgi:anaerobic selenocysteine-containing dehydrogenase
VTPAEETKEPLLDPVKNKSSKDLKKFPKSSHAQAEAKRIEEEKKKAEEEAKKIEEAKKLEEEKKRMEEEKKKKKEEVKKPMKKDEVKELSPEEVKAQQVENHKNELRKFIDDSGKRKVKLQEKLELLQNSLEKFSVPPKEIDLVDQSATRKFLSTREEEVASKILNTRSVYSVVVIEGDSFNNYEINGFCIRTIEEDANFVEEVDPKTKGKPKTAAKKK